MSTSAGNAAKGEKGKSAKYATLDINTLYKTKGNEQEVQLQKNTAPRKHGLQKLGSLPSARRPTNLPSIKAESTGSDSSAVNLIAGSNTRWGNKPGESNQASQQPTTTTMNDPASTPDTPPVNTLTIGISQQAQHVQQHPMAGIPNVHAMAHMPPHGPHDVKTWAMMTHGDATGMVAPSFLTHQSPLFQQEFPSLSADMQNGANAPTSRNVNAAVGDTQYGPGPSLRPQTEGNWIQGGGRSQGMIGQGPGNQSATAPVQGHPMVPYPHIGVDGVRNNLGQSGAVVVPGGPYAPGMIPHQMLPPQFRSVMPPFMLRNYPSGFPPPNFQPQLQHPPPPLQQPPPQQPPPQQPPPPLPSHNRMSPRPSVPPTSQSETHSPPQDRITSPVSASPPEDVKSKPSPTKEEDVKPNNDSLEEASWADCVEDYLKSKANENENQNDNKIDTPKTEDVVAEIKPVKDGSHEPSGRIQLMTREKPISNYEMKFSESRQHMSRASQPPQQSGVDHRSHLAPRFQNNAMHRYKEEDYPDRRRNMDALQKAKQRKEEEEKRYIESKEAAAKKLKMLEERMAKDASSQDNSSKELKVSSGLYTVREANIPLPDWEKERPKLTATKSVDECGSMDNSKKLMPPPLANVRIPVVRDASEFKELTQIGDRNTFSRMKDKESGYSSSGSYSRHNNDIPPRFQKQQANSLMQRQNVGTNLNILQQSDSRKNNAFQQSQYSNKPAILGSRRDRKDSDMSSIDNDKWEDERRKDHYSSPDNEYNVEKDRYSRNYHHEKGGRDNEFRERSSYLESSPRDQEQRDYNKRNVNFYTDSTSPRDAEWEPQQHDRDRPRAYDKELDVDGRRPLSRLDSVSREQDRGHADHGQEQLDRNRERERDHEPAREREMERNYEYDRGEYRRNVPHSDGPYRSREQESKRNYMDQPDRSIARVNEYEEKPWETSVAENERERRRDYNYIGRTISESSDKDHRRRSSYEYESYDTNKYVTEKIRDRDVHHDKIDNYPPNRNPEKIRDRDVHHDKIDNYPPNRNPEKIRDRDVHHDKIDNYPPNRNPEKRDRGDLDYEIKNEYEYDKRDRDFERDVRHDKRLPPPPLLKNEPHERTRKDSRNSHESVHDEVVYDDVRASHSSWAEETEQAMKYSRRDYPYKEERIDNRRDHYIHPPRYIPGPITRERLEAVRSDQESKANLTQLVRSSDKRNKKPENTVSESVDAVVNSIAADVSEKAETTNKRDEKTPSADKSDTCYTDNSASVAATEIAPTVSQQPVVSENKNDVKKDVKKDVKEKEVVPAEDVVPVVKDNVTVGGTSYSSNAENVSEKYQEHGQKSDGNNDKRTRPRRSHSHTIYNSKRERIPHQRNPPVRYQRWLQPPPPIREKKSDWVTSDYSVDENPIESKKEEKPNNGSSNENRLTNRNARGPPRKTDRNDRNYDYHRQPQESGDFYSNSSNRKYDTSRANNREHQSGSYNESIRRGRGGFTGRSGYGPPSTKRPFTKPTNTGATNSSGTAQSENEKGQQSVPEKETVQLQPLMPTSEKQSSSATVATSADKPKSSDNSGNKSSGHDTEKRDGHSKTDHQSKDNSRSWKTKRFQTGSYSSSSSNSTYKKSTASTAGIVVGQVETEEAWETASEGTSVEDKEYSNGTGQNRQSRQSPSRRSVKPSPRRTAGHRSTSGKRGYESRRSTAGSKRETQQFYDSRKAVTEKLARVKAASEEKDTVEPAIDNAKNSSGTTDEKIKSSSERSGRPPRDRKNTRNEYSDKYDTDYQRPLRNNNKRPIRDVRGGAGSRQKSELLGNRLPSAAPAKTASSSVSARNSGNGGYNSRSIAPRFQKDSSREQQQQCSSYSNNGNNNGDGRKGRNYASGNNESSSVGSFNLREPGPPKMAPAPTVNAWDKPLTDAFKSSSPSPPSGTSKKTNDRLRNENLSSGSSNSSNSGSCIVDSHHGKDKISNNDDYSEDGKMVMVAATKDQRLCEGVVTTTDAENYSPSEKDHPQQPSVIPPSSAATALQTIIIENTSYKSDVVVLTSKNKYDGQLKTADGLTSFESQLPPADQSLAANKQHDPMEMALALSKAEDGSDVKLDFSFDSADLAEDNKSGKSLEVTHSIQIAHTATAADLNFKIASVKKVWEDGSLVHFEDENGVSSFVSSFNPELNDNNVCYVKNEPNSPSNVQVDNVAASLTHAEDYGPVTQIQVVNTSYGVVPSNCTTTVIKGDPNSSSTNVCKVKPQPQSVGSNVANVTTLTTISSAPLNAHAPPVSSPSFAFSPPTPQPSLTGNATAVALAAAAAAHINFQAAAQYSSMPPIPSPPTVLFSTNQQLAGAAPIAPSGLYQAYQIESTQVISNQPPRSQFGQYPAAYGISNGLGQTSGFNQQSVYVHQAGPPPPPAISAAPQDIYSSQLSQYRMQAPPPPNYGNSQQLAASPNTVLISSSTNSLMSAAVKPPQPPQPPQAPSQQIAAMTGKGAYSGPQPSQIYIPFEPSQILSQNYMSGNQMVPPRPGSNVPPPATLPPVSSFFNAGSSAEHFSIYTSGQSGYFQGGTNSIPPQPAAPFGLSAFGAQSAATAIPNFNSQMNQPFRGQYVKGNPPTDMGSAKGIMANPHDILNAVYQPGPQQMTSSSKPPRVQNSNKPMMQPSHQALNQPPQHSIPPQHGSYTYPPPNQAMPHHHVHPPPPPPQHHHQQRSANVNAGGNVRQNQYPLPPIQRPMIGRSRGHDAAGNNSGSNNNSGNQRGGSQGGGSSIRG